MTNQRPKKAVRESAALTAVADALDLLLESRCPRPSRLWQMATGADSGPDELRHILTCGRCRTRAAQVAAASGDPPAAWAALAVAAVKTRVARQRLGEPGALATGGKQVLTFDADPHLETVCAPEPAGVRWLSLEHRLFPPGLLLALVIEVSGGAKPWVRYAMLRPGVPHAAARVQVEAAFACRGERQMRVEGVDLEDVPSLPGAVVRESFEAAQRDDPAAVPHWQAWARDALALSGLPGRLRDELEVIARA
jgi:hypothetical protein